VEYLTVAEVLMLHARLIQRTGGSGGVREMGLLESALARPKATFDQNELYPDLWTKAAALMHSLIRSHPFVDGNKRTALTATGLFLELNGHKLLADNQAVLEFIRQVAIGAIGLGAMARWLEENSQPITETTQN
jgi:death-on-curing protein